MSRRLDGQGVRQPGLAVAGLSGDQDVPLAFDPAAAQQLRRHGVVDAALGIGVDGFGLGIDFSCC